MNEDFITSMFGANISQDIKFRLTEKSFNQLNCFFKDQCDYIDDVDGFVVNFWLDKTHLSYEHLSTMIEAQLELEHLLTLSIKSNRKELKKLLLGCNGYSDHELDIKLHEDPDTIVDYMSLLEIVSSVNVFMRQLDKVIKNNDKQ